MFNTISFDALSIVSGGAPSPTPTPTPTPKKPEPKKPEGNSGLGDACRDAYVATGAAGGGLLTSETGGWGAIPGAVLGGIAGRALCPK